jgi:wobble nucleotide-excising tRNase
MKRFLKTYKVYLVLLVLLWLGIGLVQYLVISPIKADNKRQKKEVLRLEKENKAIDLKVSEINRLLVSKDARIKELEAIEEKYKSRSNEITIIYEKEKFNYISRSVAERRRIFAKLAKE